VFAPWSSGDGLPTRADRPYQLSPIKEVSDLTSEALGELLSRTSPGGCWKDSSVVIGQGRHPSDACRGQSMSSSEQNRALRTVLWRERPLMDHRSSPPGRRFSDWPLRANLGEAFECLIGPTTLPMADLPQLHLRGFGSRSPPTFALLFFFGQHLARGPPAPFTGMCVLPAIDPISVSR